MIPITSLRARRRTFKSFVPELHAVLNIITASLLLEKYTDKQEHGNLNIQDQS